MKALRSLRRRIRHERDTAMAWSAAVFMLSTAAIVLEGVAGDFWGWRHGFLGMGTIAAMLVIHEVFVAFIGSRGEPSEAPLPHRFLERFFYIGLAGGAWGMNQYIDKILGGG